MRISAPRAITAGRFAGTHDCTWHAHEGHELVLVESGRCTIVCGETELPCSRGTLVVLPRGKPQYQRTEIQTRTCYLVWQAGDAALGPTARTLQVDLDSRPARWLRDLCDLFADPNPDQAIADALLLAVLASIRSVERDQHRAVGIHPALAEATRMLSEDLTKPLDQRRLAARVGLSPSHLARLFREHHGCPPLRFQHHLRLRLAERLLQDPTLTVGEVGRRCGWDDPNNFCRVFARHAGRSPGRWRGTRH